MGIFRDCKSKTFTRPDRRYRLAKECLKEGRRLPFGTDRATRELYHFLRDRAAASAPADRAGFIAAHADIADAFELRKRKMRPLRNILQAYLMTKADEVAISERIGLSALTVRWYRTAFFDIRHTLKSSVRTTHELIGLFNDDPNSHLDHSRLCKLIAYKLGIRALDAFLGVNDAASEVAGIELSEWIAQQSQAVLTLKQLMTAYQLNVNDPKHLELLVRFRSQDGASRKGKETALSAYERHVEAFLQALPFSSGNDAELLYSGTPLGKFDEMAAELRDEEVLRLAAGRSIDEELDLPPKIPPPRKRSSNDTFGHSTFGPIEQQAGSQGDAPTRVPRSRIMPRTNEAADE